MSLIYKEMKRCYQAGEFVDLRTRPEDGAEVSIWSKDGRFLQLFPSRLLAERAIETQRKKAEKFIAYA